VFVVDEVSMCLRVVSPAFAMLGALAWQATRYVIKNLIFVGFLRGGRSHGVYFFQSPGSHSPSLCLHVSLLFFSRLDDSSMELFPAATTTPTAPESLLELAQRMVN